MDITALWYTKLLLKVIVYNTHTRVPMALDRSPGNDRKNWSVDVWPWMVTLTLTFDYSKCATVWDTYACQISSRRVEYLLPMLKLDTNQPTIFGSGEHDLTKLERGALGDTTCQIEKLWAVLF